MVRFLPGPSLLFHIALAGTSSGEILLGTHREEPQMAPDTPTADFCTCKKP